MSSESKREQDEHNVMVVERIHEDELGEPRLLSQMAGETSFHEKKKVPRWARWVGKWMIIVYRFHLGWLMGHRFLLVTHRGRKTGKVRQTGVMVLRYDRRSREAFVAAGSAHADWYRNIHASPALEVALGRQRYRPEQRFLEVEEIAELLAGLASVIRSRPGFRACSFTGPGTSLIRSCLTWHGRSVASLSAREK